VRVNKAYEKDECNAEEKKLKPVCSLPYLMLEKVPWGLMKYFFKVGHLTKAWSA